MPVIKRYPNRKLYDTTAKQYISLEGVAGLIRGGADVEVVDNETGEDVTALVLAQIIAEAERRQGGYLPQSVLAGLIQAGGQTLAGLRHSLAAPLELLRHVDEEIERRVRRLIESGELAEATGARLLEQLTNPIYRGSESWPQEANEPRRSSADAGDELLQRVLGRHAPPTRADIQGLSDQLDALAREVERLSQRATPDGAPAESLPPESGA
jgi:polyhydroxyalkanoate synthesis repressor PhaR